MTHTKYFRPFVAGNSVLLTIRAAVAFVNSSSQINLQMVDVVMSSNYYTTSVPIGAAVRSVCPLFWQRLSWCGTGGSVLVLGSATNQSAKMLRITICADFGALWVLLCIAYSQFMTVSSDDIVVACGGFVKSDVEINYSLIEVRVQTFQRVSSLLIASILPCASKKDS